jgi:hypothetical protein
MNRRDDNRRRTSVVFTPIGDGVMLSFSAPLD